MRRLFLVLLSLLTSACPVSAEPNWRPLPLVTNNAVDKSWSHLGYGRFTVDDNALRANPEEQGMGLLVYTAEKLGNCRIRVVYKTKDAKSNSGLYVRVDDAVLQHFADKSDPVKREPDGKLSKPELEKIRQASEQERGAWWPVHHGYEIQICDTGDAFHRTGAVYSLAKAAEPPKPTGEWRTMVVTLDGTKITVAVDGKTLTQFDSEAKEVRERKNWSEPKRDAKRPAVGYIGLQSHDPGDVVWFKEVSVAPLDDPAAPSSAFDLKDWKLQIPGPKEVNDLKGYASEYFRLNDQREMAFHVDAAEEGTTENARYVRSELRHMPEWHVTESHTMTAEVRVVSRLTPEKLTVLQIHGITETGGDAPPLLRIAVNKGDLVAILKTDSDGDKNDTVVLNKRLGTASAKIEVTVANARLKISVNGQEKLNRPLTYWKYPNYFKAGAYPQSTSGTAEVFFRSLTAN